MKTENNEIEEIDFDNDYLNSDSVEKEFDNELLDYALHYARCGHPVFPIYNMVEELGVRQCSCWQGLACKSAGKHPINKNGLNGARIDENEIIKWWDESPDANIGLLTGEKSGIFVLDIDRRMEAGNPYNGEETLEIMQDDYRYLLGDRFEPLPATLTAVSGSGSRHLYFKYDLVDYEVPTSNSKISAGYGSGKGLDIKGDGGCIIAPPSNHKSGNKYQWFGHNTLIEYAPNWLMYEIQKAIALNEQPSVATKKFSSKSKGFNGHRIPDGERSSYMCGQIRGLVNSFPREEVLRRAFEKNHLELEEPITDIEIIRTVNWAIEAKKTQIK